MLRRQFVKTTSIAVGGIIVAGNFVFAAEKKLNLKPRKTFRQNLRLKGIGKNGCATPPDFQDMIESGISDIGWR